MTITIAPVVLRSQEKKEEYPWWIGTEDRKIIEAEKKKTQPRPTPKTIPWHDGITLTQREYRYLRPLEDLAGARLITGMDGYTIYKRALLKNREKGLPMGASINQSFGWTKPQWAMADWEWRMSQMYLWLDRQEKRHP